MNCPFCDAVISSRRSGKCGVCAKSLPPEFLFTPEQRAKIEAEKHALEKQHEAYKTHLDRTCDHIHGGPFAPPRPPL